MHRSEWPKRGPWSFRWLTDAGAQCGHPADARPIGQQRPGQPGHCEHQGSANGALQQLSGQGPARVFLCSRQRQHHPEPQPQGQQRQQHQSDRPPCPIHGGADCTRSWRCGARRKRGENRPNATADGGGRTGTGRRVARAACLLVHQRQPRAKDPAPTCSSGRPPPLHTGGRSAYTGGCLSVVHLESAPGCTRG